MAELRTIWVIHTTSTRSNADTENEFELEVRTSPFPAPNGTWAARRFPPLPTDERESGTTDQYEFDLRGEGVNMELVQGDDLSIRILGDDAWLPSSIWVIGQDATPTTRLLAAHPLWPTSIAQGWFSRDPAEGRARRTL
jgi:hypothetical protein